MTPDTSTPFVSNNWSFAADPWSRFCVLTPRYPRTTVPLSMRLFITKAARLTGIENPMPMLPREVEMMAVLIPTRRPLASTSAPPELPTLMAASV